MDEMDKNIKNSLDNKRLSRKYQEMISNTMKMISNNEIKRDNLNVSNIELKKKNNFVKVLQSVAAIVVVGIIGATVYAGATGKLNIKVDNTGHNKVDKNYTEIASVVDKTFENDYMSLTLESMATDPAYLIYECNLKLKDKAIKELGGEVLYDKYDGYQISVINQLFINDEEVDGVNSKWNSIQKIADNQFRIIIAYNIANIRENSLNSTLKLESICLNNLDFKIRLNREITANINFNNKKQNILAKSELSDGSTLYIEEVANSKFENYVLARIVSKTKHYNEIINKENEFLSEDTVFALCDQDGNTINYKGSNLERYYEIISDDGKVLSTRKVPFTEEEHLMRTVEVSLLRLQFDENNPPTKLKILPLNRKIYSDRNDSEFEFYKNEDWYQVKVGDCNITEETVMGSVTITKIEENDNDLIFYYDTNGFVPNDISFALRVKDSEMNFIRARKDELKYFDGDENKIIYSKDVTQLAGMENFKKLTNYKIDDLDKLEFAIFYPVKYEKITEPLEFDWNMTESTEKGIIEDIELKEYEPSINYEIETGYRDYQGTITEVNESRLKFDSVSGEELTISNPKNFNYCNEETKEDIDFSNIEVGDNIHVVEFGNLENPEFEKNGFNPEDYRKIFIIKK